MCVYPGPDASGGIGGLAGTSRRADMPGTASPKGRVFDGSRLPRPLVARELTGLSQRKLALRAVTSRPSLAKIEPGSRIPTLRSMLRIAAAAGYELVLGLMGADEDPPLSEELEMFALLGVLRPDRDDDLADLVVFREPSVFGGPKS